MTVDGISRTVSNFFFYALLDESLAIKASAKAYKRCMKKIDLKDTTNEYQAAIVFETYKVWSKYQKKLSELNQNIGFEGNWILPPHTDMGLWRQFLRDAEPEEFLAVLWSRVLKFPDDKISQGLGVTVGTVRHRTNRGLKKLGSMRVTVFYDE